MRRLIRKTATLLATGLGLGYSPIASGTVGSIWGVLIVIFLLQRLALGWQIGMAIILSLIAIPICNEAEAMFRTKDDGRIVADEYMTFPICLIGLVGPDIGLRWLVVLIAFLTFRFFDIVKIPPASQSQNLSGGLGIVLDDVFAALYSLAANYAIIYLLKAVGIGLF